MNLSQKENRKKASLKNILTAINLSKSFAGQPVLKDISLHLKEGASVSIMGASGEGKTTLLHILAGLEKPDKGSVEILKKDAFLHTVELRQKHIGFIFQSQQLLEDFSVLDNVLMPFFIAKTLSYKKALERAEELLSFVELSHKKKEKARFLSGGEKQRTAIARAFMNDPSILFADEPTGNLDHHNSQKIQNLLLEGARTKKKTLVIATHDPVLASLCGEKRLLQEGYLR